MRVSNREMFWCWIEKLFSFTWLRENVYTVCMRVCFFSWYFSYERGWPRTGVSWFLEFCKVSSTEKALLVVSILFWHSMLGGRMLPSFYSFFSYLNIWRYKMFLNQFPLSAVGIECDVASHSIWKEWYVQLASIVLVWLVSVFLQQLYFELSTGTKEPCPRGQSGLVPECKGGLYSFIDSYLFMFRHIGLSICLSVCRSTEVLTFS